MTGAGPERYDAVVIGVGGMGSATVAHLAARGLSVLGLERYDVPHEMGSSHGESRIIRRAQGERPAYVPLVERAYELWTELDAGHDRGLFHRTGSVHAGPPGSEAFEGSRAACEEYDIEHEVLDAAALRDRFPGYEPPAEFRAVYQPDGGFLVPEECIVAHVERAHADGATVRARERVLGFDPRPDGVRVRTDKGEYVGDDVVVTAGAWAATFLPGLADALEPQRRVMAWLQPRRPDRFTPEAFPVFTLDTEESHYYGFPVHGVPGFKFGRSPKLPQVVDPDEMSREPTVQEEELLRSFAEEYFPAGAGPTMRLRPCIVTESRDGDFVLDTHPEHDSVHVAAGFSGNGFKFCSVVGEIMADLVVEGESGFALDSFSVDRFDA